MNSYRTASVLTDTSDGAHLDLATALASTPEGVAENPVFFTGFLTRPDIAAAGLLAVADVAASQYVDAGLAQRVANIDPVVTAGGDRLRFESFSACNGVFVRLDLLPDALGSSQVGFGTTNVDINQPLRTALARVHRNEALHLSVGHDALRASSLSDTYLERKVNLPDRWVRGLAEVPAITARMTPVATLHGADVAGFLGSLPRTAPPGLNLHVLTGPGNWRTTPRALPGSVPLPGASRLRGADRVMRYATSLTLHATRDQSGGACSASWVFEMPGARFTLTISPSPFRGFSGEGTLLSFLTHPRAEASGRLLHQELGWDALVDAESLGTRTGLSAGDITAGLAWLAASGRLGHDLHENAWFHRELPIDSEKVLRRNPRLVAAHTLVCRGSVHQTEHMRWRVSSTRYAYDVMPVQVPDEREEPWRLRCSCPWELKHAGARGPCKHALAVLMTLRDS